MTHVASIEDQLAIRGLLESYGDAVAQRDAVAWGRCWADDASWDILGQTITGQEAIVGFWKNLMNGFAFTSFSMSIGRIIVEGNRAHLRVYASEELWDKEDNLTRIKGQYDDELIRTKSGWQFAKRHYTILKSY